MVLVAAPDQVEELLGDLPAGVTLLRQARPPYDVVLLFVTERRMLAKPSRAGREDGSCRRPLGVLAEARVGRCDRRHGGLIRDVVLPLGLVDNKVCAVDETWSGLRIVYRLKDR